MKTAESHSRGWKRLGRGRYRAASTVLLACWPQIIVFCQLLVHPTLRKLAIAAVAAGLVFAPLPASFGSDALESAAHAALAEQEAAEHGHSHDEGEAHGPATSHQHGHDPADHTHQLAHIASGTDHWTARSAQRWPTFISRLADPGEAYGIDRPPKLRIAA